MGKNKWNNPLQLENISYISTSPFLQVALKEFLYHHLGNLSHYLGTHDITMKIRLGT
jgi:hypothetical protein